MAREALGVIAPHPPIMVPAVGHGDAEVTRSSAAALRAASALLMRYDPTTVVVMSPHGAGFADSFAVTTSPRLAGDLGRFGAPSARHAVPGDTALADAILALASAAGIPAVARQRRAAAADLDHGVLVPMHFLDPAGHYPLVELSLSFLPYEMHRELGRIVARAAERTGRRVAFVASGDCSHRLRPEAPAGYSPRAHLFDERLVDLLAAGDFEALSEMDPALVEEAGECGLRSFITLGGFLQHAAYESRVLTYESPWGVGYLTAVFGSASMLDEALGPPEGLSGAAADPSSVSRDVPAGTDTPPTGAKGGMKGDAESTPVRLARETIEVRVREGRIPPAAPLADPELPATAGAFVSLHRHGELRGCIGTVSPVCRTLAEEIVRNAVEASCHDPRFPPVGPEELDDLDISVDVLHEPEPVSSLDDLDPRTYGVIVTSGWRRGLLLPDLEGVDSPEQQVSIAMRKAGIVPGEHVSLERFRVDRHV